MNTRSPAVSRFDQNFPPRRHHGYDRGMEDVIVMETGPRLSELILPALGVAFAAFCVWLGVRVVNRRERWAKWTGVALLVALMGYPLSFGPAYWMCTDARGRVRKDWTGDAFLNVYAPIIAAYHNCTPLLSDSIGWYLAIWGMP